MNSCIDKQIILLIEYNNTMSLQILLQQIEIQKGKLQLFPKLKVLYYFIFKCIPSSNLFSAKTNRKE